MDHLSRYIKNKRHYRPDDANFAWVEHEQYSMIAVPVFRFINPSAQALGEAFSKTGSVLLSYASSIHAKPNAVWYVCRQYDPKLANPSFVKSAKRGNKHFTLRFISLEEVCEQGFAAYADTRSRVGLGDGTQAAFLNRYNAQRMTDVNLFLGAYSENTLVAFVSMIDFGDALEVEGHFSMNEHLKNCPNDALVDFLLNHYLNDNKYGLVSYGFSSIQLVEGEGLNVFKIKCGFEAVPIVRVFKLNPKYRLIGSTVSRHLVQLMLRLMPTNRVLKKIQGVLIQLNHE